VCEQCSAATETLLEAVPGFKLVQATVDGCSMKAGEYGLVESNDPCMIFAVRPRPCPPEPPEGTIKDDDYLAWMQEVLEFAWGFDRVRNENMASVSQDKLDVRLIWRLMNASVSVGYQPHLGTEYGIDGDGDFWCWLFDRIGRLLAGEIGLNKVPSIFTMRAITINGLTGIQVTNATKIQKEIVNVGSDSVIRIKWKINGEDWIIGAAPFTRVEQLASEIAEDSNWKKP